MVSREELLREPVEDIKVDENIKVLDLIKLYEKAHGFMAGHLAKAVQVLTKCLREADLRIISFTANIVATGLRGIIAQLVREGVFNLIITTCGTIDHDVARSTGGKYYRGSFNLDDVMLNELQLHRLGNILIPLEDYGPRIEKFVRSVLDQLDKARVWSVYEILWEIGRNIKDENSILNAAYITRTPVIVPGFTDGAFGTTLFTYMQVHRELKLDPLGDEKIMAEKVFSASKIGALIIGGGISKHHTIWWAQFKGGLDYAVYITTAVEYDGSLSGAYPREAISWGKIKPTANTVMVYGDATLILPIIATALIAEWRRLKAK